MGFSNHDSNQITNHTLLKKLVKVEDELGKKIDEVLSIVKNLSPTDVETPGNTTLTEASGSSIAVERVKYTPTKDFELILCNKLTKKETYIFATKNSISLDSVKGKKEMVEKVCSYYAQDRQLIAALHLKLPKTSLIEIFQEQGIDANEKND